jgi:hypothetical protein
MLTMTLALLAIPEECAGTIRVSRRPTSLLLSQSADATTDVTDEISSVPLLSAELLGPGA